MRVRTRLRKPWRRFCTRRLVRAMVGRGPQRICSAASAGCVVMADLGTRSAAGDDGDCEEVEVEPQNDGRSAAAGDRKMLLPVVVPGTMTVGRRLGMDVKDLLWLCVS